MRRKDLFAAWKEKEREKSRAGRRTAVCSVPKADRVIDGDTTRHHWKRRSRWDFRSAPATHAQALLLCVCNELTAVDSSHFFGLLPPSLPAAPIV